MKIDKVDLNIIELLKDNGRIQNNEIAARLSVSEGTVRNRIKKLTDNGYLSIKGLVNPEQVKYKQIIFLGVQLSESKRLEEVAQFFSEIDIVSSVYVLTGRYDLLIELFLEPFNLIEFLSNEVAKINCVASTESFVTLKSYKKWI